MRVADYIAEFISESLGCENIFMVTGGGMMFLSDGIACNNKISAVCTHHEQAAAMAATAQAKYSGKFGCAMLTTGCGGTNAVTGVLNAWQDGAKAFFISGQVKLKQTIGSSGVALRQFGVQEADIVSIVQPITKYAAVVTEPETIAYHLEKAKYLSENGNPGPVWLDIPMDIQGSEIHESQLLHFSPPAGQKADIQDDIIYLQRKLSQASRPVVLAGQGIDLSHTKEDFYKFIEALKIPVVTSFLGGNSISGRHPQYIGRIGTKGNRAGNLTIQNADFLLVLGCRLSVSSTGHDYSSFARNAEVMVVDTDPTVALKKTVKIDRFCHTDLRDFFQAADFELRCPDEWYKQTVIWRDKYFAADCNYQKTGQINLYGFLQSLSEVLKKYPGATVVSDAGSSFYATTQAIKLDDSQRYVTSGGQAEMGFSLPAAIGIASAAGDKKVIAITGDGSLQMNIQELQTVRHYHLPVKLFVWNNNGYLSIRATQRKFFDSRFIGTDPEHGVSFPDLKKISSAYDLPFVRMSKEDSIEEQLERIISKDGPVVCEVICDPEQEIVPTVVSLRTPEGKMKSLPLEDMYPLLPIEELQSEMKIPLLERE